MALMMVAQGLTRAQVEDPAVEVAFPESVVDMMQGNLGQPPGGLAEGAAAKVLKGEPALTERPGAVMPPADLGKLRAEAGKLAREGEAIDDEDFNGYLMYPKVFTRLSSTGTATTGRCGRCRRRSISTACSRGRRSRSRSTRARRIEVRLQAVGETNEEGDVRVFFELNGQPRTVRVPNRKAQAMRAEAAEGGGGQPGRTWRRRCRG